MSLLAIVIPNTFHRGIGNYAPAFLILGLLSLLQTTPVFAQSGEVGGYTKLFNGTDLTGWAQQWPGIWHVADYVLSGRQNPADPSDSWLFTNKEYDDFSLSLSYRITKGGNSGVGFRMPAGIEGRPSEFGFEMQIWKEDPDYPTGSIYKHAASSKNPEREEQWNQVNLTCVGEHITVFINREKVTDAIIPGPRQGRIGLQVHGGKKLNTTLVEYCDIYIKDLKPQYAVQPAPFQFIPEKIDTIAGEGCAVTDINHDGKPDITHGPVWYESPAWKPHPYRLMPLPDNTNEIAFDVNRDGWNDIIYGSWYSSALKWVENPGKFDTDALWQEHLIANNVLRIETITPADIGNTGNLDILVNRLDTAAPLGYFAYTGLDKNPTGFEYRIIDPTWRGNGIGFGDINGDGAGDILTPSGWYDRQSAPAESWNWHPAFSLPDTSTPILLEDFNRDGKKDILTGRAHGFGLYWLEQTESGWKPHVIDDTYSEIQSVALADLDGDGENEIIAGKRYLSDDGFGVGFSEPLCIFWYDVQKGPNPTFTKYTLTYDQNIGTGFELKTVDIDQDGDLDIIAAGKSGLYLLRNTRLGSSGIFNWRLF